MQHELWVCFDTCNLQSAQSPKIKIRHPPIKFIEVSILLCLRTRMAPIPEHRSFLLFHETHARSCKIMQNMHMEPNKAIKQPFFSTSRTKFIVLLAALSMPGGCFHSEAHSSACLAGQHSQNILRWGASSKR